VEVSFVGDVNGIGPYCCQWNRASPLPVRHRSLGTSCVKDADDTVIDGPEIAQ
jgi:hypothetical protein